MAAERTDQLPSRSIPAAAPSHAPGKRFLDCQRQKAPNCLSSGPSSLQRLQAGSAPRKTGKSRLAWDCVVGLVGLEPATRPLSAQATIAQTMARARSWASPRPLSSEIARPVQAQIAGASAAPFSTSSRTGPNALATSTRTVSPLSDECYPCGFGRAKNAAKSWRARRDSNS